MKIYSNLYFKNYSSVRKDNKSLVFTIWFPMTFYLHPGLILMRNTDSQAISFSKIYLKS